MAVSIYDGSSRSNDTSKKLSVELAKLAQNIRKRINTVLSIESEDGPVTRLMEAFKKILIHDLEQDDFADMYAQTISYGLLSTRVANPSGGNTEGSGSAIPLTNPFLRELLENFINFGSQNERLENNAKLDFDELGVSEVIELLDAANMEAVVRDFGDRTPQEDPVIHFFEGFLQEYDSQIRKDRGVFYTPRPVVSFIVRSVTSYCAPSLALKTGSLTPPPGAR